MTVLDAREDAAPTPSTAVRQRGGLRRALGWAVVVLLVLGVAFVGWRMTAVSPDQRGGLDPEGRSDNGSLALAEILREQGVVIDVARTRAEVLQLVREDTTLVMANPYSLSDDAVLELVDATEHVVFLSTSSRLLRLLEIGENAPAALAGAQADCRLPEVAKVGTITPDRLFLPEDGVIGCFGSTEGTALLVDDRTNGRHVVIEGSRLFSNGSLAEEGNAALGLALLGQTGHVVWYVPSFLDSDIEVEKPDTLGTLTPDWLTPAILLLLLAGVAAAVWRGQRFGPLVAETLPVTVRASETMHGRARLTAKAADSAHAGLALRDGARRRLARRLALAVTASADEIADAAADRLRIPRGSLQDLLAGPLPTDDASLIELARRLDELETAVDRSTHLDGGPA